MSKIIFSVSNKVSGSPLVLAHFATFYRTRQVAVALYDGGGGVLHKIYPGVTVSKTNPAQFFQSVVEVALRDGTEVHVLDVTGLLPEFQAWLQTLDFHSLTAAGLKFIGVGVHTTEFESLQVFLEYRQNCPADVEFVLVQNEQQGDDFSQFRPLLNAQWPDWKSRTVSLPRFPEFLIQILQNYEMDATKVSPGPGAGASHPSWMDRMRISAYQNSFFRDLQSLPSP